MNSLTRSASNFVRQQQPILMLQRGIKKNTRVTVKLLKDIPMVGSAGSTIEVGRAHMRHVLYPRRLAAYVISYNGPRDRVKEAALAAEREAAETKAGGAKAGGKGAGGINEQERVHNLALHNQDLIGKILRLEPLVFERKTTVESEASENAAATIYGSVTKADVLKMLAENHGIVVDRSALTMDEKIKTVGEYSCEVKLIYAGNASFKFKVVPMASE
ncbi:hypothetical protein GGI07_005161 [Coemansia sp. Benny D115]|nr:hypothetical protein GGI07_005161 [Coemansia sp. Benny D115]